MTHFGDLGNRGHRTPLRAPQEHLWPSIPQSQGTKTPSLELLEGSLQGGILELQALYGVLQGTYKGPILIGVCDTGGPPYPNPQNPQTCTGGSYKGFLEP